MTKRVAIVLVVLAIVAVAVWRFLPRDEPRPRTTTQAEPAAQASGGATASPRVRKLSHDERRELGDKIKAAIAKARAGNAASAGNAATATEHPGSAPALPDEPTIPLEQVSEQLMAGLKEALPLVAECYKQYGSAKQAAALMTMISDPELGTVIDTEAITDRDGKPIASKLDECMRDTIDALALPPLGQPGKLKLQYTFRFDD
jgi:hypothetical protein